MAAPRQPSPLILASSSPRRRGLLREAGYAYDAVEPSIDEPSLKHPHVNPVFLAESIAYFKASSVAARHADATILGADTIAVLDGEIIGKPADAEDAGRILRRLSGTTHSVVTGLTLLHPASGRRLMNHDTSTVRVRALDDSTIDAYLATGDWQGKAGAYGVQDQNDPFVETLEGSFSNVVGLPMELLSYLFERWDELD